MDDPLSWQTGATRYDAWGTPTGLTGTIPQYGYTGREPDATGLIYYRARYYDPTLGRFISRDPTGFAGGDINLYTYVRNNPVNFDDPSGEFVQLLVGAGIGAFAGGLSAAMNHQNVWAGIGIGAVSGAAVSLVGPSGAAAVNAIANATTQYFSGTRPMDINLTSVALAALAGPAGKFVTGALVRADVPRTLAQITTGLAVTPIVTPSSVIIGQQLPVTPSTLPVPSLETAAGMAEFLGLAPQPDPWQGRPIGVPLSAPTPAQNLQTFTHDPGTGDAFLPTAPVSIAPYTAGGGGERPPK
jgi:RHS repeat-associated protein